MLYKLRKVLEQLASAIETIALGWKFLKDEDSEMYNEFIHFSTYCYKHSLEDIEDMVNGLYIFFNHFSDRVYSCEKTDVEDTTKAEAMQSILEALKELFR